MHSQSRWQRCVHPRLALAHLQFPLSGYAFCHYWLQCCSVATMHNPNICKTFSRPSSIPMDCIFCCISRAFLQIYLAWCRARLEDRSNASCLGGMFSNVCLSQSMHRSSHVNGVQGGQKRIFGICHECVCYFWVGTQCSQCTFLPILI